MSVIVYWSSFDDEWLRAKEPDSVIKDFIKNDMSKDISLNMCPGFKNYFKNTYNLRSLYDYEFYIKDNNVISDMYNQEFFSKHVIIRSLDHKAFSFNQKYIFFTEEKSLEMSLGIPPFLMDNFISNNTICIPGKFDIGKWFRSIDIAFYLKDGHNNFKIKENEPVNYIKFDTDKKIIFKQFMMDTNVEKYLIPVLKSKSNRKSKPRSLYEYYNMFKNKKKIIKEIKNNLI